MSNRRKKFASSKTLNVNEATRIRITQALEDFTNSDDSPVLTFDAGMPNFERAEVHKLCRKYGLTSKSSGVADNRQVSVYKPMDGRGGMYAKKGKKNISLEFSNESKAYLRDLFSNYPPKEDELNSVQPKKHNAGADNRFRKNDDSLCRPSMDKAKFEEKVKAAFEMKNHPKQKQIQEGRSKLPIAAFQDSIVSTVESNQVVLISGETGCGKTTQVPQYLLDYMWGKGEQCKILCTQPRRISAISVAERISWERGENVGETAGYKIRMETKGGKNSSVMFCTNGILLRVLVERVNGTGAKDENWKSRVSEFTHIVVDEIHERDHHSDFILTILRDLLPSCPNLRLILMSATLDAERFSQYFGGCPVVRVPGFTYPVRTFYMEDVLSIIKPVEGNHLDPSSTAGGMRDSEVGEDNKAALDEAIELAWSSDEFDPLLELLVSAESTSRLYNYQHSLTGASPLMVFAGKGRIRDVCTLLSFGVDCNLRAKDGTTALEWAERANQGEVAEIIKQHISSVLAKSAEEQGLLEKYYSNINPDFVDIVLVQRLLKKICSDSEEGAILVFVPGWDDINKIRADLLSSPFFKDSSKFVILSLHSMIPSSEQKKVFQHPPKGSRKIILSTNIAETAITIDDVVYVIDSGRMKEKSYDPYNNVSTLQSSWVSKASARQREGRAGRCRPGICYHLYSRTRASSLIDFQVPEIKRMPIEELCLKVKMIDPNCSIADFLQKTLDPPVYESVRNAVVALQQIGALTADENLTDLGQKLGALPVHPTTSRMLFFAILMSCLDPALTLACATEYRDPFVMPIDPFEKQKALEAKAKFTSLYGGVSDHLMTVAAYECWEHARNIGQERQFCSQYYLSSNTLNMLSNLRKQLIKELIQNGFISEDISMYSMNARDPGVLHAVLVAAMYPMVAKLIPQNKGGTRTRAVTASGSNFSLLTHPYNIKSLNQQKTQILLVYDDITRGDRGMYVRDCTVVGPYPLLLLGIDMVVAPSKANSYEDDGDSSEEEDNSDASGSDGETNGTSTVAQKRAERIMASPENAVSVVIDRWLTFESTAIDVAQMYCLRERLKAAILFKVKYPQKDLPPYLKASVDAIASILSHDGLSGIPEALKGPIKSSNPGECQPDDSSSSSDSYLKFLWNSSIDSHNPNQLLQGGDSGGRGRQGFFANSRGRGRQGFFANSRGRGRQGFIANNKFALKRRGGGVGGDGGTQEKR
ncbi:hypothetical protein MKX01_012823 [Papaver californicum]|nr:hypothetical protein MKX01_012823 [Papaver californicum]